MIGTDLGALRTVMQGTTGSRIVKPKTWKQAV